jgi:hypothetical protein
MMNYWLRFNKENRHCEEVRRSNRERCKPIYKAIDCAWNEKT